MKRKKIVKLLRSTNHVKCSLIIHNIRDQKASCNKVKYNKHMTSTYHKSQKVG